MKFVWILSSLLLLTLSSVVHSFTWSTTPPPPTTSRSAFKVPQRCRSFETPARTTTTVSLISNAAKTATSTLTLPRQHKRRRQQQQQVLRLSQFARSSRITKLFSSKSSTSSVNGSDKDDDKNNKDSSSRGRLPIRGKELDLFLSKLTSAFPLWVVSAVVWGMLQPTHLSWINNSHAGPSNVELMLALVMMGMGMTLETKDFMQVIKEDWSSVPFGVMCQFGIMPLAAWIVGRQFLLPIDPSLFLGLALVGCCPGGTASNLVSLIAGANVALSVLLTAASTVLAAVGMTPLLVKTLVGGTDITVSGMALFLATIKVVLGPVVIGMIMNAKLPKVSKILSRFTPFASVLLVALICGGVVAKNVTAILSASDLVPRIFGSVLCLHVIGFLAGYLIPKFLGSRYTESTCRTISIETGMQNSALAVVLAQSLGAPPMAALPGAISALTHSCLGSLLAAYWRIMDKTGTSSGEYGVRADGTLYKI